MIIYAEGTGSRHFGRDVIHQENALVQFGTITNRIDIFFLFKNLGKLFCIFLAKPEAHSF